MIRKSSFCAANRIARAAVLLSRLMAMVVLAGCAMCGAASAPEWLTSANKLELGHFGDGYSAVIVGKWDEFTVDATGKFVSTERCAVRVLNRRAAEGHLRAYGFENTDEKVVSISAWTISPAGRVAQSDKKEITTQSDFAGFELFSDSRVKTLTAPGAEDGSLFGYEVVREGRLAIHGERFFLEDDIPVRFADLRVAVPSGSLRWFINHPDRVEVVSQSANAAEFKTADRPGIPQEADAPPFQSLAAMVAVNYDASGAAAIQSWADAARAETLLYADKEKSNADILAEVEKLDAGKADDRARLDALYTFVSREIRYVAVEIGIGGYQPHAAADTFRYKYGDCKDKATLLLTMLDHVGLRGNPALVGTRGDIEADPGVPTLATFDHMIVALPVPDALRPAVEKFPSYDSRSKILWIDPTSDRDPLGQVPEMDQGVFALILRSDGGELQRIPETPPDENGLDYDVHVRFKADGNGSADVQVKYMGSSNARRHSTYHNLSESDLRKMFEARVANYVTQADFHKASIAGVEDNSKQIVEHFSFDGAFATASAGDGWFFQPLFLSGMEVPEVGMRARKLPLDLGGLFRLKGQYRLEFPAGMHVEQIPPNTALQSEFGAVKVEYSQHDNVLVADQTVSFTVSRIPPEKYADFRDFVNNASREERRRLRVVPVAPVAPVAPAGPVAP